MRSLPLLLLLAGARVEGRQEGKNHLGERQLLLKQANCSQLLDTFSESSSNFTRWNDQRGWPAFTTHSLGRCANQYAQPIFMCRKCLDYYLTVIEIYDALRHRWVKSLSYGGRGISSIFVLFSAEAEVSCKDLLTSRDKVEIIKATFAYIAGNEGLWNRFPSPS